MSVVAVFSIAPIAPGALISNEEFKYIAAGEYWAARRWVALQGGCRWAIVCVMSATRRYSSSRSRDALRVAYFDHRPPVCVVYEDFPINDPFAVWKPRAYYADDARLPVNLALIGGAKSRGSLGPPSYVLDDPELTPEDVETLVTFG